MPSSRCKNFLLGTCKLGIKCNSLHQVEENTFIKPVTTNFKIVKTFKWDVGQ